MVKQMVRFRYYVYLWMSLLFAVIVPTLAQDVTELNIEEYIQLEVTETQVLETVKWSPNGEYLALGGYDGVWIFNAEFEQVAHFNTLFTDVVSLDWSPDSSRIAISTLLNDQPVIIIINIRTGNNFVITPPGTGIIVPIRWSPDGALIVIGNFARETLVFDAVTGDVEFVFQAPTDAFEDASNFAYGYCWLEDSQQLVAVYNEQIFIFNMQNEELITQFDTITSGSVDCSPDGSLLLAASRGLVNLNTGEKTIFEIDSGVAVSWHPSSAYFAVNSSELKVHIWSADGQRLLAELEGGITNASGGPIYFDDSIDWHPDGELLAAVGEDNIMRIWRVEESP